MARTAIAATAIAATGYNLTDSADFTTLSTGSGNGVSFDYSDRTVIILKNDTGGAAVFTLIVNVPVSLTTIGVTPSNQTVSVATGKTYLLKPGAVLKSADGEILIDCDVAGKVLLRDV